MLLAVARCPVAAPTRRNSCRPHFFVPGRRTRYARFFFPTEPREGSDGLWKKEKHAIAGAKPLSGLGQRQAGQQRCVASSALIPRSLSVQRRGAEPAHRAMLRVEGSLAAAWEVGSGEWSAAGGRSVSGGDEAPSYDRRVSSRERREGGIWRTGSM